MTVLEKVFDDTRPEDEFDAPIACEALSMQAWARVKPSSQRVFNGDEWESRLVSGDLERRCGCGARW